MVEVLATINTTEKSVQGLLASYTGSCQISGCAEIGKQTGFRFQRLTTLWVRVPSSVFEVL